MGGILKIFKKNKKLDSIDISENNLERMPEEREISNSNIIKIHIYGVGERKKKVIKQLFDSKITREDLKVFGDNEYKSNDFYWIIKKYEDALLTEDKCDEMEEKIENEKAGLDLPMPMKHHILLLFGDNNDIQMIVQQFSNINRPRIIFVTEKEKEYPHFRDQKYVKNIVCEGMNDQQLNNYIVSSLWELDCYFNEKGNEIDRYSPKSIVKGLETDNSFFSINILLTGLCRTGKSTFINLLTEKLIALESNEAESVTLKVSEYYIHRNDDKKEHGAIKLIDTPGLCDDKNVNEKVLHQIKDFLENKNNQIEKQIHFVFFFFMEGNPLLNSKELLKLLDESKYPVFFIINKSHDKSWKGSKSQDIRSKISFLKKNDCRNLAKEENFIQVNIKSESEEVKNFYGVDNIFKKIEEFIKNNLLNENILKNLNEIHNKYQRAKIKNENTDDIINQELFEELKNNLLFKNITLDNIKRHGRNIAEKYEKNIILLSGLKNVFPAKYKDIPKEVLLQAFMIKEIGIGYGFDFNNLNYCFRQFDKDLKNMCLDNENIITDNDENRKGYNNEEIENQRGELQSKIEEIMDNSNEEVIERLVQKIIKLTSENKEKITNNNNEIRDDMKFIKDTKAISLLCQTYFEKELDSTRGIPFIIYYFIKNQKLMDDIQFFINKKDWEKDTIEIIKTKK